MRNSYKCRSGSLRKRSCLHLWVGSLGLFLMCGNTYAHENVDAGVYDDISKTYYFFFEGVYIDKPFGENLGNYSPLEQFGGNFPDTWSDGIDAAVFNSDTGRFFFFKWIDAESEWQYISKDHSSGSDFSAPASINQFASNDFPAECAVDAAVYDNLSDVYYFFKGDGTYCSKPLGAGEDFIVQAGEFSTGYPVNFPLDAVTLRTNSGTSTDRYFFFSPDEFIQKDYGVDGFSAVMDTRDEWGGWPAKHGTPIPVEPIDLSVPDAVFTDTATITAKGTSNTITDRLIAMINAAQDEVYLGVYLLADNAVDEALFAAHQRGVFVTVLTDDDEEITDTKPAYANRDNNLDLQGKVDYLHFVATNGFIHNKVALFPRLETISGVLENVIFSSSANYTSAAKRKYQDAMTVADPAMFTGFLEQIDHIIVDDKSYILSIAGETDGMRAYFFPRDTGTDTVADILQNLRDATGNGDLEFITVRINMGSWTDTRFVILDQLDEISNFSGGNIQIIASGWKDNVFEPEIRANITGSNVEYNFLDANRWNAHSKYMLVDVGYRDENDQLTELNIVYAGSENFTGNALTKHFESWIKNTNPAIYAAYDANFKEIWRQTTLIFLDGFEE